MRLARDRSLAATLLEEGMYGRMDVQMYGRMDVCRKGWMGVGS